MTGENKWQVHRAGLLNYWYYDEAEFAFAGGRLMLRGSNGSGKSVTMQSLVTVLLDGVTQASRLDSFGSRSRRMEDYLLGEPEISGVDERTGYLYLEYKKQQTEEYLTTGIGLHAKRGSGRLDFWGFLLKNGRRIGKDFELYSLGHDPETGRPVRIPLEKRELVRRIGADGQVVSSQGEYMQMVNDAIFGFADIRQYRELMALLIQLRSPKLSRDFKPSVIYEILNASLPALSDEELRPLSETLENMEETRLALEQMKREAAAFTSLSGAYTKYNEAVLGARQLVYERNQESLKGLEQEIRTAEQEKQQAEERAQQAAAKRASLRKEETSLREEQKTLMESKVFHAAEEKEQREKELQAERLQQAARETSLREKRKQEVQLAEDAARSEEQCEAEARRAEMALEKLSEQAEQAAFDSHATLAADFSLEEESASLARVWQERMDAWHRHLGEVIKASRAYAEKQREQERAEKEYGEAERELDAFTAERGQLIQALARARDALTASYYEWKKTYKDRLPIPEEPKLLGLLGDLYETADWRQVTDSLDEAADIARQEIASREGKVRVSLVDVETQIAGIDQELAALRETKEARPELTEEAQQTRELLQQRQIPFVPLYEATEFRKSVPEETRARIESALLSAGLLDALLLADDASAQQALSVGCGNVLLARDPVLMGESLFDYLEPVESEGSGVTAARIAEVLSGIEVTSAPDWRGTAATQIDGASGIFVQGSVGGMAPRGTGARFIGRQAREALRAAQIAAAEEKRMALSASYEEIKAQLAGLEEEKRALREARRAFPDGAECRSLHEKILAKDRLIETQKRRAAEKDERRKQGLLRLREMQQALMALRADDPIPADTGSYEAADEALGVYRQSVAELWQIQQACRYQRETLARNQRDLAQVREDAARLEEERQLLTERCAKLEARIQALAELLQELGAEVVSRRIAQIGARLGEIPAEQETAMREETRAEAVLQRFASEQEGRTARAEAMRSLTAAAGKLVQMELAHGFLGEERTTAKGLHDLAQARRAQHAKALGVLLARLNESYNQQQGTLSEYSLHMQTQTLELGELLSAACREQFPAACAELAELGARQLIVSEAGGHKSSPYDMLRLLTARMAEQQDLITQEDEHLFREILMNSVGTTISEHIFAAERWVMKMNAIMSRSETSSGLRFHLDWRPADRKEDASTKEIVDLLHADANTLTEDDRRKLTEFFRKRVEQAKDLAHADETRADAWTYAVRDLLDYRQWFAFQLSYDKGEAIRRRPLSDKRFLQFSGGEKAMAMYAPLFSAAYSKYQEAGPEAPYLITLDEAFAGVDEQNMRDMFRLVESMQFNYIMNSQAVWGEYDVVPSLNIYELIRPASAPFVTLAAFHWDGHQRTLLGQGEEDADDGTA